MQLFLHVGAAKTGTSTLQVAVVAHRTQLLADGILVPDPIFRSTNHNLLVCSVLEDAAWPRQFRGKALHAQAAKLWESIRTEVRNSDAHTAILSAEYISILPPDATRRLSDELRLIFDEITPVVYVREPAAYYLSAVQQGIRAKSRCTRPSQFNSPMRNIVTKVESVFGSALVRKFDRATLKAECIVRDFFASIGCDDALTRDWVVADTNQSLSAEGMCIMQRFRAANFPDKDNAKSPEGSLVMAALAAIPGQTKARLRPGIAEGIRSRNAEEIDWFRDRYAIDFMVTHCGMTALPPEFYSSDIEQIVEVTTDQVRMITDQVVGYLAAAGLRVRKAPRRSSGSNPPR